MGSACSCMNSNTVVKANDELELIQLDNKHFEKNDEVQSIKNVNSIKSSISQNLKLSLDVSLKNTLDSCNSLVKQVEESLGPFKFSIAEDESENFPITDTVINKRVYIGQRDEIGQKCG